FLGYVIFKTRFRLLQILIYLGRMAVRISGSRKFGEVVFA
ncbi:MAG: hypothetical protein ACJA16_005244, partial [Akkermansiaceae bacterium]